LSDSLESDFLPTSKKIFCNTCQRVTNHCLKGRCSGNRQHDEEWGDGDGFCDSVYSFWMCAGCETATLEWQELFGTPESGYEQEDGEPTFFPTRSNDTIRPKRFFKLNPELRQLYYEVIRCFNTDSLILCTIGLRALLEGICKDKSCAGKDLMERIDNLFKVMPSLNLIEGLHHFRLAGNDAVHDLQSLTRDDARKAIEVMEDLLNYLYDLDYKATEMRNESARAVFAPRKPGSVQ
jgi:hypothetical protein